MNYHRATAQWLVAQLVVVLVAVLAFGGVAKEREFSRPDDYYQAKVQVAPGMPRLLTAVTIELDRRIGSFAYTSIALHAGSALLVSALGGPLAGALFAAHPMVTDAVAGAAGRSTLLCVLLLLGASLAFVKREWTLLVPLIGLAAFAREEALVAPMLLSMLLVACADRRMAKRVGLLLLGVSLLLTFLAIRQHGTWDSATLSAAGIPRSLGSARFAFEYLSAFGSHALANISVWPMSQSVAPLVAFTARGFEYALVAVALLGWGLWSGTQTRLRVGCALVLANLLIYAMTPLQDVMMEHRLYMAVAGFALIAAELLGNVPQLGFLLVGLYIGLSMWRVDVYSTPEKLWRDAYAKPHGAQVNINLGMVEHDLKNDREAERLWREVLPNPVAASDIVAMYIEQRDFAAASRFYKEMTGK